MPLQSSRCPGKHSFLHITRGNGSIVVPGSCRGPTGAWGVARAERVVGVSDWSLITGRGGGYKTGVGGGGGHVKFCPYEKGGGAEKVLAML